MFPALILVLLLTLIATVLEAYVTPKARAASYQGKTQKVPWLPILVSGMPLAQSGHKAIPIGAITLNAAGTPFERTLPAPPTGFMYNNIHLYGDGIVTAAAGADVGNASLEIVNTVDLEAANGDWHIRAVRFIALYYHQFARNSYTPTASVDCGAGGGAAAFNLHVPVAIKAEDGVVKLRLITNAFAVWHSSATAIAIAVAIRVDAVKVDTASNTRRVIYRENVIDALAIAGTFDLPAEVLQEPTAQHAYMFMFTQSAAGTLANLFATMHYIIAGVNVIQVGTTWEQIQEEMTWDYDRAAVVAGIGVVGWDPRKNNSADIIHILNGAAACTRTTGLLQVYFGT